MTSICSNTRINMHTHMHLYMHMHNAHTGAERDAEDIGALAQDVSVCREADRRLGLA